MLYINNTDAYLAIETERRSSLGLRKTTEQDPTSTEPASRGEFGRRIAA